MSKQRPTRFVRAASAASVMCALLITGLTLYVLVIAHWHGPFRDMWEIFPFLQKIMAGTWTSSDLWESYGYSHRLFLPRLLFVIDHQFFNATNHFLIFVSVICQVFICGLFAIVLWHDAPISSAEKYGLIAVVVFLQFSATLLFNFMHAFDVQWFVCCLFVVVAFYLLSKPSYHSGTAHEKYKIYHFAWAGFFITAACLGNFSAMAAWPIWIVLIMASMTNIKLKILLVMPAVFFILFYVAGIRSIDMGYGNTMGWLKLGFYIFILFPLTYLSNPLSNVEFLPLGYGAIIFVMPVLYVLMRFWWRFIRHEEIGNIKQPQLFLACIGLFGYGVALMSAIGRGYDPGNVYAMRYQNIVLLFWSAMITLVILESYALAKKSKYLLCASPGIILLGFLWCQPASWNQNIWLGYQVNRAHLALMMGYSGEVPMIAPTVSRSMIYVPGYNLEAERKLYEEARKGIYQGDLADRWLNGVSIEKIQNICQNVSWKIVPYEGAYSRYLSYSVSGDTKNFNAAVLLNNSGRVLAAAIPEGAGSIEAALQYTLGLKNPSMRGFALPNQHPSALVMLGASPKFDCKLLADTDSASERQ